MDFYLGQTFRNRMQNQREVFRESIRSCGLYGGTIRTIRLVGLLD